MTVAKEILRKRVQEVAAEVVAEYPDAINPRDEPGNISSGCRYNKRPNDLTPNTPNHCLGGEVLVRLGLGLPDEYETTYGSPDIDKLSPNARVYLRALQYKADDVNYEDGINVRSMTWSEAKEYADEHWEAHTSMQ